MSEEYSAPKHIATWNGTAGVWETPETLLCAHSALYSETLPTWGFMRGGELFPLPPPELPTGANECSSLLPTPLANSSTGPARSGDRSPNIQTVVSEMFR
jgi:hypothetical protein